MKLIISAVAVLFACQGFAQSSAEQAILDLSNKVFRWEVEGKTDSLGDVFHEKFVVVGSTGESRTKEQYLATLRSGNFIHNSIDVELNTATVAGNTAVLVGKARFTVTANGNKNVLHLSYMEVFTRPSPKAPWKILALHAGMLQN